MPITDWTSDLRSRSRQVVEATGLQFDLVAACLAAFGFQLWHNLVHWACGLRLEDLVDCKACGTPSQCLQRNGLGLVRLFLEGIGLDTGTRIFMIMHSLQPSTPRGQFFALSIATE